ncbi:MAG: hypothetical protein QM763_25395 [Agriterribacter sp.]
MRKVFFNRAAQTALWLSLMFSCSKKSEQVPDDIEKEGRATFWMYRDLGCGQVTVTIDGISNTISKVFSLGAPVCGEYGAATFTLEPGSYAYSAKCTTYTWSGTITVTAEGCSKMLLDK